MLTVGSRGDGRKRLGLGFGVEMEENELEEGEACSGHEGESLTSQKDLVNLSYIDEKLQDVLGHFQKDFEGGVSAENLGAMFGGYGSFLPTYQRSPSIWCQPRSPPNASSHNGSRSPDNTLCEGARQNHLVSTCASINKTSASSVAPSFDKPYKKDLGIGAINSGETITQHDSFNKLVNGSDQKTLKVRIKVGPESVSARDNAAIYSGLGLDISPSSSLEDSPCGSEGLSTELRDAPDESPMTIIQIMTCFPVPGGYLLSPLPDNLLYLSKKEKSFLKNFKSGKLSMAIPENCAVLADLTASKGLQKKMKILEKNGKAMDMKNSSCKDDISSILRREIDIETQDGQEIVSDALNIPILSGPTGVEEKVDRLFVGDSAKASKMIDLPSDPNKLLAKGRVDSSEKDGQRELVENIGSIRVGASVDEITHSKGEKNLKTSITEKVLEEKIVSNHNRSSDVRNEDKNKNEKCYGTKGDFDEAKGKKDFVIGSVVAPKDKVVQKANLYEQDKEMMFQDRDQLFEGGGKSKKSQTNGAPSVESTKRNSKAHSSSKSKEKKSSSHVRKGDYLENKFKDSKFENEHPGNFSKETHIDLEDMKTVENRSRLLHVKDKLTEREQDYEDPLLTFSEKTKERPVVKKVDNPPVSEEFCTLQVAPLTLSIPASDAVTVSNAPVLIKENWVCCDRCQKWRLLPYGANPDLLPKKWQCSMLDWLQPGMNRCNISEEETTKALNALYQMPVPQSNTSLNGIPDVAASNMVLADPDHLSHTLDNNMNSVGAIDKKKHKSKDKPTLAYDPASLPISSSAKKNLQASFKSRSLNDVNHPLESNLPNKVVLEHVSKSTDVSSDKQNLKHKEKHRILGRHSDGGDLVERAGKPSKSKSKREVEQDGFGTSKKFKRDGSHHTSEDRHSEPNSLRNGVLITDNGLPTNASQHNMQKYNGYASFKEVNGDSESNLPVSSKRTKVQPQSLSNGEAKELASVLNMEKSISDSGKKRKIKNWQESQEHLAKIDSSECPVDTKAAVKETFSENEMKREKKPKVSKPDVNESSTSKADGRLEKKGCTAKILLSGGIQHSTYEMEKSGLAGKENQVEQYQVNTVSRQALDGVESLKKDLAYPQTSAAATSSSSKISGSRKSRGNLQEVKGSPVESVSSSPFRNSNSEKPFPSRRKSGGKDDAGFSVIGSPKNCSDGEADDGNNCPDVRNNKGSTQRRAVEGHRSMDSQGLVSLRGTYDSEDKEAQGRDGIRLKLFGDTHDDSSPTEFEETTLVNNVANASNHRYKCRPIEEDHTKMNNRYLANGSVKSGKSSCTRSRDNQSFKSSNDKGKMKVSDSLTEQGELFSSKNEHKCQDNVHNNASDWTNYPKDLRYEIHSYQEKDKEDHSVKKESKAYVSSVGVKGVHTDHAVLGNLEVNGFCMSDKHHKDLNSGVVASGASCGKFGSQDNPEQVSHGDERNLFDRSGMLVGGGKSKPTMSSRDKQANQTCGSQAVPAPTKGVKSEGFPSDARNGDALKAIKPRKPDEQIGSQHGSLRQATPNRPDLRSPSRRDGHSVASVLKEARDLKHTANRLKSEGLELESTGLYFQAALKFLYYAFLLEPNAESARNGEGTQSMQMYSDTARLCEFCAHEYERCKQMAAASLAYKCVEVAYMKVSYFKHSNVSKDRHELQTALQIVVPGESPSSSASDVDNLNNQGTLDKGTTGKGVGSPQVAGNHVIAARNRPSFVRLLNYANETVCAFDASKKMQIAFAAASSNSDKDGSGRLVSVRNVLDFNFHNVERLLQLIRLAMESISCL